MFFFVESALVAKLSFVFKPDTHDKLQTINRNSIIYHVDIPKSNYSFMKSKPRHMRMKESCIVLALSTLYVTLHTQQSRWTL